MSPCLNLAKTDDRMSSVGFESTAPVSPPAGPEVNFSTLNTTMKIRSARSRLLLALFFLIAADGLLPKPVRAETRTAAALTPEAVWEAIDAAKDGDTVQLPAGTAVWSKGWNTGHGAKMKAITIQGAGIDKTIIGDDRAKPDAPPFVLLGVEGKPFRVTGITLRRNRIPQRGELGRADGNPGEPARTSASITASSRMPTACSPSAATPTGWSTTAILTRQQSHGGNVQPVDFSGPGAPNYRKPLTLGTAQAMYFEDNEVYIAPFAGTGGTRTGNNPWIAPHGGSRVVIRHNKIVNSQLEIYRPGLNKQYGSQSAEIYDNQFSVEGEGRPQGFIFIGAGVAIVFNNTVTGTTYNIRTIELRNERAWRDLPGFPKADGKNPIDGNQIPAGQLGAGYPCFGQVGWATNVDGSLQAVALLCMEQHPQRRAAPHGSEPPCGCERGGDDQGRPGFLQREAAGGILQAVRLSASAATRAVTCGAPEAIILVTGPQPSERYPQGKAVMMVRISFRGNAESVLLAPAEPDAEPEAPIRP